MQRERRTVLISLDGDVLHFRSCSEAGRFLGVSVATLTAAIKRNMRCHGYRPRYADERTMLTCRAEELV
jgi:hypothetical protein